MNQIDLKNIKNKLKTYIDDNEDMNNTSLAELFLSENEDIRLSVRSVRRYVSLVKAAESDLNEDIQDTDISTNYIRVDLDNAVPLDTELEVTTNSTSWSAPDEEVIDLGKEPKIIGERYVKNPDIPGEWIAANKILDSIKMIEKDDDLTMDDLLNVVTTPEDLYHFELKQGKETHSIDRHTVDMVICAYSRHGLNLTTGLIQSTLGVSADIIKVIIYRLGISKESQPYSEYSEENLNETELYDELDANISFILDKLHENDGTVTTKLNKVYKKSILLEQHKDLKFKSLVTNISEALLKIDFEPIVLDIVHDEDDPHTHIFIPDMHIGMTQANYDLDIIREQLKVILEIVVDMSKVHVHFMGDIIHSVSGMNHKDSWKNMDPKGHGAEAIIQPYKLLVEFLSGITDLFNVNIVGGNHDRLQSSRDQENTGEGAKLIGFMLQESFKNIPITFDSYRIVDDTDPHMTVILLHGDKPIDKASGESIAWTHGNSAKFNYIATAHMHSRKQNPKDDGLKFRKEALPAFCPMDSYSKTVAHGSLPGIKLITTTEDKLPVIIDMPLHYDYI